MNIRDLTERDHFFSVELELGLLSHSTLGGLIALGRHHLLLVLVVVAELLSEVGLGLKRELTGS